MIDTLQYLLFESKEIRYIFQNYTFYLLISIFKNLFIL